MPRSAPRPRLAPGAAAAGRLAHFAPRSLDPKHPCCPRATAQGPRFALDAAPAQAAILEMVAKAATDPGQQPLMVQAEVAVAPQPAAAIVLLVLQDLAAVLEY